MYVLDESKYCHANYHIGKQNRDTVLRKLMKTEVIFDK